MALPSYARPLSLLSSRDVTYALADGLVIVLALLAAAAVGRGQVLTCTSSRPYVLSITAVL
ncbi:hypothetical protein LPJ61_002269, partial [Coemansia biformis]